MKKNCLKITKVTVTKDILTIECESGASFRKGVRELFKWNRITDKRWCEFWQCILFSYKKDHKIKTDDTYKVFNKMFKRKNGEYRELRFYG